MTDQPTGPTYALYASFAVDPARPVPEAERPQAALEAQAALESTERACAAPTASPATAPTPTSCCGSSVTAPTRSRMR